MFRETAGDTGKQLLDKALQQTLFWLDKFGHLINDDNALKMCKAVADTWDWIDEDQLARRREYKAKKKELQSVVHPIIEPVHYVEEWVNWYTNDWGGCTCPFCGAHETGGWLYRCDQ